MRTADNDGVSLAYETRGPATPTADPETVVFIEGLGYGRWMWRWQAAALDDEYRVLLFDNRGTGDSDAPEGPYTIAEMASDVEAVLDDAGVESAHVVGASMGGMIAQQYALDYDRTDSLSLLCTSHGGDSAVPTPQETQALMFDVPEEYDEREAIRYKMRPAMTESFAEENEDLVERIVEWRLASDAPDHARESQAAAVAAFDSSARLSSLSTRTLVTHGTADRVLPAENGELLADAIPNAEYVAFEGGPHLFFIESAAKVNETLRGFLADV
jgi:pimeloyl-ACP methyl ester carboxylesterase